MLGDGEGMTAGKGMDGLGETERRIDWPETDTEPNEERRLWVVCGGGFIGRASDRGVPGALGAGDSLPTKDARPRKSGGAGLLCEMRRVGMSILLILLWFVRMHWPSFVLSV